MAPAKLAFEGTVIGCETRFSTKVTHAFAIHEPMTNWVLTIRVERADEGAPAPAGTTASFLIHSPTHTLFTSAAEAVGLRFAFSIVRTDMPEGTRWSDLRGQRQ
jgi:hypothetical protein